MKQQSGSVIEKLQKRRKSLTQKGVQQVMIKKQKPRVYVKSMNNRKISPIVSMKYRKAYQLPKQIPNTKLQKQPPKHSSKPISISLKPKVPKQLIDRKKEKVLQKLIHQYILKDNKQEKRHTIMDEKLDHSLLSDRSISQQSQKSNISMKSTNGIKSQRRSYRSKQRKKNYIKKQRIKQVLNTTQNRTKEGRDGEMLLDCQEMLTTSIKPQNDPQPQ